MIRALLLCAAGCAATVALVFLRPHATPGPTMRDFEAYYAAGATYARGGDPYSTQIWNAERGFPGVDSRRYEVLPFVGPPALLPLLARFSRIGVERATFLWQAILIVSLAALLLATLTLCGRRLSAFDLLAALIFALGFAPVTSAIALGQLALPGFAAAAVAAAFITRSAVAAAAVSTIAWIQPNAALALLSQAGSRKGLLAIASGIALFVLACVVPDRTGEFGYLRVLHLHGAAERFSAIQLTPAAIAYGFGATQDQASVIAISTAVAAVLAFLWFASKRPDAIGCFAFACALLPFAVPFFHEHNLVIAFVPVAVFTLRASALAAPAAIAGSLLCATDWIGLAQRPDGAAQTLLLVSAAAIALVLLRADTRAGTLSAACVPLILIALAAPIAAAHVAPVWPDAMTPLPAALEHASVSAVWHGEQLAAGLLARNPVWALLRGASLLGCALLTCAAALDVHVHQLIELRDRPGVEVL